MYERIKLTREQINELILEPGVGDLFCSKIESLKENKKEIDDYQVFHDSWVDTTEMTKRNRVVAWCRTEVIRYMTLSYEKELKKWQKLLRQHLQIVSEDTSSDLSAVKAVPLEDLYTFEKARNSGGRVHALCPLHADGTPSFVIYLENNTWHCFGCSEGGDNIAFVMALYKVDFKESLKLIKQYGGIK